MVFSIHFNNRSIVRRIGFDIYKQINFLILIKMTRRIAVLGYYGKSNLGDEMFRHVFPKIFPRFSIDVISTENLPKSLESYFAVVLGGGDLFNSYFLPKFEKILSNYSGIVYAVGVGLPYPNFITEAHLSRIDHIFLRNWTDLNLIGSIIGHQYTHYLPDLGFKLEPKLTNLPSGARSSKLRVAVCLAQNISALPGALDRLELFFAGISSKFELIFYRFNTSGASNEDDGFINQRFAQFGLNDPTVYTVDQMLDNLAMVDFAICMRFHAHIFATIVGCPFFSIYSTRKVELYLSEHQLTGYNLSKPSEGTLSDQFVQFLSTREQQRLRLIEISVLNRHSWNFSVPNQLLIHRQTRPKSPIITVDSLYTKLRTMVIEVSGSDPELGPGAISSESATILAPEICFEITGLPGSRYEYGTWENLQTKPQELKGMIDWIHQDWRCQHQSGWNFSYMSQDNFRGLHRAGWQYVLDHLKSYADSKGILCDTYADRTFLWCRDLLRSRGIIPYTSAWVGFLHHTPNTDYTENSTENIFLSDEWKSSLPTCRGIICLSRTLADWVRTRVGSVPVFSLFHPTVLNVPTWTAPAEIRLVQIGAWYRNPFSIYRLKVPSGIKKLALRGPEMSNYFPPDDWIYPTPVPGNQWVKYCLTESFHSSEIASMIASVEVVEKLSNSDYDRLLISVVVFLDLVDASAVNTIIECIARATPVILNRLPAVVEYLGSDYPLYYSDLNQVAGLCTPERIGAGHQYLLNRTKNFISIDTFLEQINLMPI